jgi:hypothetical protein
MWRRQREFIGLHCRRARDLTSDDSCCGGCDDGGRHEH